MDPREFILNFAKQNTNPFISNLIQLALHGNTDQLKQIARNMGKEQNRDFDKEFETFKQNPMSFLNFK